MQKLIGQTHIVSAIAPETGSSATTGDFISLKNYAGVTIIIALDITSSATDSSVTLEQAKDVTDSGSLSKTLGFTKMYANLDTETSDALVATAVTSNTFEAGGVTKSTLYVIEVRAEELDGQNGFDCLQVLCGAIATAFISVIYVLHSPRYINQEKQANFSAITN